MDDLFNVVWEEGPIDWFRLLDGCFLEAFVGVGTPPRREPRNCLEGGPVGISRELSPTLLLEKEFMLWF